MNAESAPKSVLSDAAPSGSSSVLSPWLTAAQDVSGCPASMAATASGAVSVSTAAPSPVRPELLFGLVQGRANSDRESKAFPAGTSAVEPFKTPLSQASLPSCSYPDRGVLRYALPLLSVRAQRDSLIRFFFVAALAGSEPLPTSP